MKGLKVLPSNSYRRRSAATGGTRLALPLAGRTNERKEATLRGQIKQWWGKLTDDDLDRIDGAMDKLSGALQERYGWERDQAEGEIQERFERGEDERRASARR
jgi:uncharacterized protein YjbJ (UPF0337 family)